MIRDWRRSWARYRLRRRHLDEQLRAWGVIKGQWRG